MNCSILAQTNTFTFRLRALHRLRFHKSRLTKRLGVFIILFELQSFFVSISSDSCTHQQLSFLIAVRSDCLDLAITISSVSLAMVTTLLCHCTNTDRHWCLYTNLVKNEHSKYVIYGKYVRGSSWRKRDGNTPRARPNNWKQCCAARLFRSLDLMSSRRALIVVRVSTELQNRKIFK